jgi:hypothetical protein
MPLVQKKNKRIFKFIINDKEKKENTQQTHTQKKGGAGKVAQVVKCLPSKNKALSSNPNFTKKTRHHFIFN